MNTMVLIPILIIAALVIAGIVMLVKSKREVNKYEFEKQRVYEATKPGVSFIFYGENGGSDPFKSDEHVLYILDEKNGWIKLEERIFAPTKKTPVYTNVVSHKKTDFINWILLHRDVQFIETK
jgi:hypothetical protein